MFAEGQARFKKIEIRKNGKLVDTGVYQALLHGTKRPIYWFHLHPSDLPDNCVLVADKEAWVLELPWARID